MVCLLQPATKGQQIIHKSSAAYVTQLFHTRCKRGHMYEPHAAESDAISDAVSDAVSSLKLYTGHLSCEHYLVQTNKFTG